MFKRKNTLSKSCRDIAMRIICDYHANNKEGNTIGPAFLAHKGLPQNIDADYVVEILRSMGYITYTIDYNRKICDIQLTDRGKCYFEMDADVKHEKRVNNIKYIITTSIAVLALILSLIALIWQANS